MEFLCKYFLLSVILWSCSASDNGGRNTIGTPIEQTNVSSMQSYVESGKTYFYSFDSNGKRINFVDPEMQSLSFSPELPGSGHSWLATKFDGFSFDVSANTVQLRASGYQSANKVLTLAGTIKSSAVDLKQGYAAFVDEYFSIGLIKVSSTGELLSQWTGGPILDGLTSVTAGEMLEGGKLVLVVNTGAILVVDIEATLAAKSWVFQKSEFGLKTPNWVGRVDGFPDRALIIDMVGIHLLDLAHVSTLQTIAAKYPLTPSKAGFHHAYYFDSSTQDLVVLRTSDGETIQEKHLKLVDQKPTQSFLSADYFLIVTIGNSVVKYRLADGLVSQKHSFPALARFGLSEKFVVAMYESALGFIEVVNLESGETKSFASFNLSVLQK